MAEEIKEDFLEVDQKIPGQNYVCLSFVEPEKIIKQKEFYFLTKFLDHLINDQERSVQDIREKMLNKEIAITYEKVEEIYGDWIYTNKDTLEAEFFEKNEYRTTMRALKVRGVYDSLKEATIRSNVLRKKDPSFNIYVGQVGYWLQFNPEAHEIQDQEYQEGQLNELVKKYKENLSNRDDFYDQVKAERIQKAKQEVEARKEALRAQTVEEGETVPTLETTTDDLNNIEKLRSIVDESDKLYYDGAKAVQESSETEAVQESSETEAVPETNDESVATETSINNFSTDSMKNLESDDPWLSRKG
jgi:heterodisulfide reductase subunit C